MILLENMMIKIMQKIIKIFNNKILRTFRKMIAKVKKLIKKIIVKRMKIIYNYRINNNFSYKKKITRKQIYLQKMKLFKTNKTLLVLIKIKIKITDT